MDGLEGFEFFVIILEEASSKLAAAQVCEGATRRRQALVPGSQNVSLDFQLAHGYAESSKVELRMRGKSWLVHLKPRASFRSGWYNFCVDNSLGEGDTCFFRAIRQGSASSGGEDHLLKVDVRKVDGSFLV